MSNDAASLPSLAGRLRQRIRGKAKDLFFHLVVAGLIGLILFLHLWPRIIVVIGAGEAGVKYRPFHGGTIVDHPYPEGLHLVWPWDRMTLYNVRLQTVDEDFEVLTTGGLPITLTMTIRYRPSYERLGTLHKTVGPGYLRAVVLPEVESVLRKILARRKPEEIYRTEKDILENILLESLQRAGQRFVTIDDVLIRAIVFPPVIKTAIEKKLVQLHQKESYLYRIAKEKQEAERKRIEAEGIQTYQRIISSTLTPDLLKWQGVRATLKLSESANSKVVVIGAGEAGLPIILGGQ